ncbi:hypothetical protein GCM10009786_14040 [Leucobacter alluvii]|uniref:HTH luxR-type domain-containing protein n=1 Tax=Leucobacter alluvii TaxID=340321 RepID=A0ABP5MWF7_9MICO
MYRIVQEAFTNALRYSIGATRVEVGIDVAGSTLTVLVADDGLAAPQAGRAPSQGSGRGVLGIAERAATYGGSSAAGPCPGGGRQVHATLQTPHVHARFAAHADPLDQLSPRERDVFACITAGLSNSEIGEALHLSTATVKTHVNRIFAKLHLHDRVHAVILGYELRGRRAP